MDNQALNEKLRELRRLRHAAEDLQHSITAAEDEVKAELTCRGVDEIATADYRVTWKSVVSMRLDAKALKEERPELYARYARQSEAKRFVVT